VSIRTARALLAILLFLVVPLPMVVLGDGWVPGVRYLLLGGVVGAVMLAGGGAGPVPLILFFFVLHALAAAGLALLAAHVFTRAVLRYLPRPAVAAVTLGLIIVALGVSIAFDVYETPFGRTPRSNLMGILS
jgi:hypothetical protein